MATADYSHSKVFDIMKNTKETINTNYTSLQYLQTLDFFLWEALKPIATDCPSLFYNYLVKVVARQTLKSSAKFSSDDRLRLPIQLFNILTQGDDKAVESAKLLYVNRGLLFGFINLFLSKLNIYANLHKSIYNISETHRNTLIHRIESQVGLLPGVSLYATLMQVQHWDKKARDWKAAIVEKYTRMALMQAQNTYKDFNHSVQLDDVVQIYMTIVNRSIDRCDARQGVLTTFIQNWFKSARGEVAKQALGQQDSSYESLIEDHGDTIHDVLGFTEPDTSSDLKNYVAEIALRVDPVGLVRTALGISQFVSREDRDHLEIFVHE